MSLLVTNLNSSTAQEVVNWVTTGEGCEGFTPPTRTTLESRRRCVLDFSCLYTVLHCKLIHVIRPSFSRNIFSVLVRSGFSTFHGLDVAANSLNFEYKCIFCIFNILLFSLILSLPVTFRTSSYRKLLMFFFNTAYLIHPLNDLPLDLLLILINVMLKIYKKYCCKIPVQIMLY